MPPLEYRHNFAVDFAKPGERGTLKWRSRATYFMQRVVRNVIRTVEGKICFEKDFANRASVRRITLPKQATLLAVLTARGVFKLIGHRFRYRRSVAATPLARTCSLSKMLRHRSGERNLHRGRGHRSYLPQGTYDTPGRPGAVRKGVILPEGYVRLPPVTAILEEIRE